MTGISRATRALVISRDRGCCCVCGRYAGPCPNVHHRRNRGSGGSRNPSLGLPPNLLVVCGSGTTLCHGDLTDNRDRARALDCGWIVSLNSAADPADIPVRHALYGLVFLLADGSVSREAPGVAA